MKAGQTVACLADQKAYSKAGLKAALMVGTTAAKRAEMKAVW